MSDLSKMEIHVNKTTNTVRFISVMLMCVTAAFLVGASYGDATLTGEIITLIVLLFLFGLSLMFVSELYWKILKKYGSTEERLLYFYNTDKKRYE